MTAVEFMQEYEKRNNTHRFEEIAPLIAEDAVYWFSEGSYIGPKEIGRAIELTWDYIKEEKYTLENVQWIATSDDVAVCIYNFHWQGLVEGQLKEGRGRGTSVLKKINGAWKVAHEHLSAQP